MDKESFFISQFPSTSIGDDGAVVGNFVYAKDLFCEGIHFRRDWMRLDQIAQKSMLVNISDAIAMNAKPKWALIGVVMPKTFDYAQLKELSGGFQKVARRYGIDIIGGDTTAGETLAISITIIAERPSHVLYRSGAKIGDCVAYTGMLGRSYRELTRLLRGGSVSSSGRFMQPDLKERFVYKAARHWHAGMDISDGLFKDLSRLLKQSGKKGVRWLKRLPKRLTCSGEEYEMLFCFDPRKKRTVARLARQTRTKMTIVGHVQRGRLRCRCREHHF